jgi:hypothetical protein
MSVSTIASLVLANTTTNAGTITLPPALQIPGRVITFKDSGGNFVNKALTLTCAANDTFEDGTTTKILRETYGTIQVAASGSKWYVISGTQVNTLAASTIKTAMLSTISISSATATLSTLGLTNRQGSTINLYQASTFLYFNNFIVAGSRVGVGQIFFPLSITDPYASYLLLALPLNATYQLADISASLRGSGSNFASSAVNSAALTSSSSKFYSQSLDVSPYSTNKYVALGGTSILNTALSLTGSDFTIEMWIYPLANNVGYQAYASHSGDTGDQQSGWIIITESNNNLYSYMGSGWPVQLASTTQPSINVWHHIALTRSGSVYGLYYDGNRVASTTNATSISTPTSQTLRIGSYQWFPGGARSANAYIQDFRMYKGIAKYTGATYTVPTQISAA